MTCLLEYSWCVSASLKAGQFGRIQWDSLKNKNRWNIHIQTTALNSHARHRRGRSDWNISLRSMIFFLGTTCLPSQGRKRFFAFRPSTKRSTTRNRSCFCYYVTSTPAIFFNFQVKRDGRESNRATNLSPPPRLKMTDIKQSQQATEKSKEVYIILPPFPTPPPLQRKKYSLLGKGWKRDFFTDRKK